VQKSLEEQTIIYCKCRSAVDDYDMYELLAAQKAGMLSIDLDVIREG
jgi:hypothetical protein